MKRRDDVATLGRVLLRATGREVGALLSGKFEVALAARARAAGQQWRALQAAQQALRDKQQQQQVQPRSTAAGGSARPTRSGLGPTGNSVPSTGVPSTGVSASGTPLPHGVSSGAAAEASADVGAVSPHPSQLVMGTANGLGAVSSSLTLTLSARPRGPAWAAEWEEEEDEGGEGGAAGQGLGSVDLLTYWTELGSDVLSDVEARKSIGLALVSEGRGWECR